MPDSDFLDRLSELHDATALDGHAFALAVDFDFERPDGQADVGLAK